MKRTDDDAVSPVIGVVLMVSVTVILAAVIEASSSVSEAKSTRRRKPA